MTLLYHKTIFITVTILFLSNIYVYCDDLSNNQNSAKSKLLNCIKGPIPCDDVVPLIGQFMDEFRLWNGFNFTAKKFKYYIKESDPSFPESEIPKIYQYVENDLIKKFKIDRFLFSFVKIKKYENEIDRYKAHHLNILNKYVDDSDLYVNNFIIPYRYHFIFAKSSVYKELIISQQRALGLEISKSARKLISHIDSNRKEDDQETKRIILELAGLLCIEEYVYVETIENFIKTLQEKCDLIEFEIRKIYNKVANLVKKQITSTLEMQSFYSSYENANYAHAWYFIENFIDAFFIEKTKKFEQFKETQFIFYRVLQEYYSPDYHKLKKLFDDHAKNYQRIKTRENLVEMLKLGKETKYLPIMHKLIEEYQLNFERKKFNEFKLLFEEKDLFIIESDISLIYQYYLKFLKIHERISIIDQLYNDLQTRDYTDFIKINSLCAVIVDNYKIDSKDISVEEFIIKVKEEDGFINELILRAVFPYVIKYIMRVEKENARNDLIRGLKNLKKLDCILVEKDYERFVELYNIRKTENLNYDALKNTDSITDKYIIQNEDFEYLTKYLPICKSYQNRRNVVQNILNLAKSQNARQLRLSLENEKLIDLYQLTNYNLKNFNNFKAKIFEKDKIYTDSKLKILYSSISKQKKLNKLNVLKYRITSNLKSRGNKIIRSIIDLETMISTFNIQINEIENHKDLERLIIENGGIIENNKIKNIFNLLIRYKKFLERRTNIQRLNYLLKVNKNINNYEVSNCIEKILFFYKISENDIFGKFTLIKRLKEFDEINELNVYHLFQISEKYLSLNKRNSRFCSLQNYIDNNRQIKYSYISKFVKLYIDSNDISLKDATSSTSLFIKLRKKGGIFLESEIKNIHKQVFGYLSHVKRINSLKLIKNELLNKNFINFAKIESYLNFLIRYYNLNENDVANTVSILKKVRQESEYFTEYDIITISDQIKFQFYLNKMKIEFNEFLKIYNDDSSYKAFMESYPSKWKSKYSDIIPKKLEIQKMVGFGEYILFDKYFRIIYPYGSYKVKSNL